MAGSARIGESRWLKWLLIVPAVAFLILFLALPLVLLVSEALVKGLPGYVAALAMPETQAAIRLTLIVAAIAVPLSTLFGIVAAWCVTKFEFRGKNILITLIDLPISVSPVIAGLVFVLIFGSRGWLGPLLAAHDVKIIFAVPGLIIVTWFVTLPFVARQLTPLMQQQGREEEESALVLGATGLQTFRRVTLPNIRWALLYGVLLCNARAMGEFGAVAVVSGLIRGVTMTMPLQIQALYQDYNIVAAFTVASLLAGLGLVTLALKRLLEWRHRDELGAVHAA